jgi:hypothetical protein
MNWLLLTAMIVAGRGQATGWLGLAADDARPSRQPTHIGVLTINCRGSRQQISAQSAQEAAGLLGCMVRSEKARLQLLIVVPTDVL